jgi:D-alanyl-D-alanine carboxypeptidase
MKQFFYIVFGGLAIIFLGLFAQSIRMKLLERQSSKRTEIVKETVYDAAQEEGPTNDSYNLWTLATSTITSKNYILFDVEKKETVAEKNSDQLVPIASLVKLISAVVADSLLPADSEIQITKNIIGTYGNTAGFKEGETFVASDLMYPLLMVSSNDAAEALAQTYGRKAFIKAMNDFVSSIGAYRTYLADPTGLSPLNVSTAYDMAHIVDWMHTNRPELLNITLKKSKTVRSHTWINPTHFLSWSYFLGGKNGYTTEANRTGALLFDFATSTATTSTVVNGTSSSAANTLSDSKKYIVVVLGSQSRDSDVVSLLKKVFPQNGTSKK